MTSVSQPEPTTTIQPLCPVFGQCGGCAYQDIPYARELDLKQRLVKELLQEKLAVTDDCFAPIVPSPKPYHYRNRLDLKFIRARDGRVLIGFTPAQNGIIPVEACPIAREPISAFLPELRDHLQKNAPARYRLANLVVRTGDDGRVRWGGIGRRSCRLDPEDYLWTEIEGRRIFYSLETFFQANLSILPGLFQRIKAFDCWQKNPVLFDLYAGVGLFSIALTDQARKIFLLEENAQSTTLARYNLDYHRLTHAEIIAGRMEETLPTLLAQEADDAPKVAVIDPPRAGLSPRALEVLTQARTFNRLFYLSCNPQTLARDLTGFIKQGWTIRKITPFDFFPKTRHIETLVALTP
ncbi:MAG: class I SAM-dependent RNA methyltransferase [Candidatus Omnitrophica bacterium]|nr:class I SAM-dependent RNA methyltransferase [Candidatus Omnitrophota bacterium]